MHQVILKIYNGNCPFAPIIFHGPSKRKSPQSGDLTIAYVIISMDKSPFDKKKKKTCSSIEIIYLIWPPSLKPLHFSCLGDVCLYEKEKQMVELDH